jgi:hypothetical protein
VEDVKGLETGNSTTTKNNSNKQDEENNSINGQGLDGSQSSYAKHDNDNEKYGIEETRSPMEDEGLIGWEQESQEWYNSSSAGSGSLTWDWVTANEEESENPQDAVKKVIENWSDSTDASEDAAMRAFINQYDFSGSTEE